MSAGVEAPEVVRRRVTFWGRLTLRAIQVVLMLVMARGVALCLYPQEQTLEVIDRRVKRVSRAAERGAVLDAGHQRIAVWVDAPRVAIDERTLVEQRCREKNPDALRQIASILELSPEQTRHLVELPAYRGPSGTLSSAQMKELSAYRVLEKQVDYATAAKIKAIDCPGFIVESFHRRYYPKGGFASQVLGYTDISGVGRMGLEREFEAELRGASVSLAAQRDRVGHRLDVRDRVDPNANRGGDILTTLDPRIQAAADAAVQRQYELLSPAWISLVAIDVRTGDILAMANAPTFNPNDLAGSETQARRNRAVMDIHEPGSVLKPLTLALALDEGLVSMSTRLEGGNYYRVGGHSINDDHPRDDFDMTELIKYSSNIVSARIGLMLGADRLVDGMRRFGLGERTDIALPGELRGRLHSSRTMRDLDVATLAFGQGASVTTLQLASAMATIANGGERMRPRLVSEVIDADGTRHVVKVPESLGQAVSERSADRVLRAMVSVTEEKGTGTKAAIPGYRVAGKTGTAQKWVGSSYHPSKRVATFIGAAPAGAPEVAIAVMVDEPPWAKRYGGLAAAPVFREVMEEVLRVRAIPPTEPLEQDDIEQIARVTLPTPVLEGDETGWRIPDLTGRTVREALAALQGLDLGISLEGRGRLVSQNPAPGERVARGQTVALRFGAQEDTRPPEVVDADLP